MTVVLIGIGADGDNTDPVPSLEENGTFDYLPIPETEASTGPTYSEFELPNYCGTALDFVEKIRPGGDGEWIKNPEKIAETKLHHDPNFSELTYGDVASTTKGKRIQSDLGEGDIIGFYTGLQSDYKHRYIIGYFTVEEIDDDPTSHPTNAHGQRVEATGNPKHDDLVIVDGRKPGGLLQQPYKISEKIDRPPWHQVSEEAATTLNIDRGTVAVARKPPLTLNIEPEEFIAKMPPLR